MQSYSFIARTILSFFTRLPFLMCDRSFIQLKWRLTMDYPLDLNNPRTYNEKQNWLKLYDRKPIYTTMVDKYLVKKYVAGIIGEKYIIPTIGVWDSADEIDFNTLPDRFVLKCNHNSGTGMYICKDKGKMNEDRVRSGLRKGLKENYFKFNREWPYKNVSRKIIAEPYLEDPTTKDLRDYKFFCMDGVVRALFIATDRHKGSDSTKFDFFDADFNHLNIKNGHDNADVTPQKPRCFDEMKQLAEKLSKGIPNVRVDFYEVNGNVLFGELTFTHWGGFVKFEPKEWDYVFGDWISINPQADHQ